MKIFISYSHHDSEIAKTFYGYFRSREFEVVSDNDISIGDAWQDKLHKMMVDSDVVLVIISEKSKESAFVKIEIGMTVGSDRFRDIPRLFPYIVNGTEMPQILKGIQCFFGTNDIYHDLEIITQKLNEIKGSLFAKERENLEQLGNIGLNLDSYIREVFVKLDKNEKRNRHLSYLMYFVSFGLLACSLLLFVFSTFPQLIRVNVETVVRMGITNTIIISIIIAMSRFSFVLGKSFMVESIRNGDRIHAISFGKFFINAYGEKATRQEVREVFGEWNIDKGSVFRLQDVKDINPNIVGAFEIIKSAITKK